ncbi:MAG: helix-turn-helix domain-containing protein, partial [Holosporales bacterium]|nr:helix-turn-helix domain-containing protein [Holosporales bacterium]
MIEDLMQNNKTSTEVTLGKRLRELREKCGLTLVDVSKGAGVSYQQIQKYEKGDSKIPLLMFLRILNVCGYGLDEVATFFDGFLMDEQRFHCAKTSNEEISLLMIEDNPDDEALIRSALNEFKNIKILCVHNSAQVLGFLKYGTMFTKFPKPNLIFLDLIKSDDIGIIKDLKRGEENRSIPIVVVTNNVEKTIREQAYFHGVAGYIIK